MGSASIDGRAEQVGFHEYGMRAMAANQRHTIEMGPGIQQQPASLLTVTQVATRLGISRSLVYAEIGRGKLKANRIGTCIRLEQDDVSEYLRQAAILPSSINGGDPPGQTAAVG
jgi:excisionase family DNA binding protein